MTQLDIAFCKCNFIAIVLSLSDGMYKIFKYCNIKTENNQVFWYQSNHTIHSKYFFKYNFVANHILNFSLPGWHDKKLS